MRYVLRADSSPKIGSGHIMRLTAIAEELIKRDETVVFVGQFTEIPWLASRIFGVGFSQILNSSTEYRSNALTDVLILDSYYLPIEDPFIEHNKWRGIVIISDELTPKYKADLMIRPGINQDLDPEFHGKCLSGPKFIPLRKNIKKLPSIARDDESLEILVVGGGTDPFNFVHAISRSLMGSQARFRARFFTNDPFLAELDSRFTCIPIGPDLDTFANSAQLVFTTASTTSLEFIAREAAVGIACAVDNQQSYYNSLVEAGVAIPLGHYSQGYWQLNELNIIEMINSAELREKLREKSSGLIDLKGTIRIVDEILKL
jgi:spore coat polysaccharide biosynthesis predicted glycosyltransferase SpsG